MFGRRLRLGLPIVRTAQASVDFEAMRERDRVSKTKKKIAEDYRRGATEPDIEPGDLVVLRRETKLKGQSTFNPEELIVAERRGGDLTLLGEDGRIVRRDITKTRKLPLVEPRDADADVEDGESHNVMGPGLSDMVAGNADARQREERTRPTRMKKRPRRYDGFVV